MLLCVTVILIGMTPWAFLIILASEAFGGGDMYYHWLSVVPLALVAVIWVFVIKRWRREESQKRPPANSKGAS